MVEHIYTYLQLIDMYGSKTYTREEIYQFLNELHQIISEMYSSNPKKIRAENEFVDLLEIIVAKSVHRDKWKANEVRFPLSLLLEGMEFQVEGGFELTWLNHPLDTSLDNTSENALQLFFLGTRLQKIIQFLVKNPESDEERLLQYILCILNLAQCIDSYNQSENNPLKNNEVKGKFEKNGIYFEFDKDTGTLIKVTIKPYSGVVVTIKPNYSESESGACSSIVVELELNLGDKITTGKHEIQLSADQRQETILQILRAWSEKKLADIETELKQQRMDPGQVSMVSSCERKISNFGQLVDYLLSIANDNLGKEKFTQLTLERSHIENWLNALQFDIQQSYNKDDKYDSPLVMLSLGRTPRSEAEINKLISALLKEINIRIYVKGLHLNYGEINKRILETAEFIVSGGRDHEHGEEIISGVSQLYACPYNDRGFLFNTGYIE